MNNNIQLIIELLLKNKQDLDAVVASLKEKHGIDIDTAAADSAMADLQASVEEIGDSESVIDADASGAIEAANDAEAEIEEIPEEHTTEIKTEGGSSLQVLANLSLAYQGFLTVAKQVYSAVDNLSKKYLVQEQAETDLAAALKNTGKYSEESLEYLKKYASGIQMVTKEGDEAILAGTALAQNIGDFGVETLPKVQEAAAGLAAAYGVDLKTAFMLIARASKGQTQTLARYGMVLDTTASKEEQFNQLLDIGADKFELAKEQAKGLAGQMEQVGNEAGDLQEDIGANLTPAILKLKTGFLETTKVLMDFLKLSDYSGKAEAMQKEQEFRSKINDLSKEELEVMQQLQINDQIRIGHNLRAFQNDEDRVALLSKENEDLMMQRVVLAEILTIKQQTQIEQEVGKQQEVNDLLAEAKKLMQGIHEIKLADEEIDTSEEDDEDFAADMERESARLEEMYQLKAEFAERGEVLNLSIYERQMLAIDEFYIEKKDLLIESGLTEEEITEQSEAAKDRIRNQYAMRAVSGSSRMFSNLGKVMKAQGRSGFEAWKRMAQSQALIDTYKAANSAYSAMAGIPFVGPLLGAAAAGAAIAAGFVNVQAIEKQKFGSGGVVTEETDAIIGELGPEAVVPLPDGRSIPVKGVGGSNSTMTAILAELKAMNLNIVRQNKRITFVIETTDPETTVRLLKETENTMNGANDAV